MPALRVVCIFTMFLVLSSGTLWAQATAELSGRVTDESGAILPGVTVTAAQTDTGFTRTVVTDERRQLGDAEPADRSVPAGSLAAGVPHLRPDGHRAAGRREGPPSTRRSAWATSRRRCRLRPPHRSWTFEAPASAAVVELERGPPDAPRGAPGHRSHHRRGRGRGDRTPEQPELPGRREHLGRRRPAVRRGLHARRRRSQRSAELRQPAAAVSGRATGIPRGHERPCRAERHAVGAPRWTR